MKKARKRRGKFGPGVSRIDQPEKKNHGFYVRLNRGRKKVSKFFSDKKYGSKAKALEKARTFYAKVEAANPKPTLRRRSSTILRSAKNSEVVRSGASKIIRVVDGVPNEFWQAVWVPKSGILITKSFSILEYGNKKAKDLAFAAQKKPKPTF